MTTRREFVLFLGQGATILALPQVISTVPNIQKKLALATDKPNAINLDKFKFDYKAYSAVIASSVGAFLLTYKDELVLFLTLVFAAIIILYAGIPLTEQMIWYLVG